MKHYTILINILAVALFFNLVSCVNHTGKQLYYRLNLDSGWYIQSSDSILSDGKKISKEDFDTKEWFKTEVPSTVMGALIKNGFYKDIYKDDNLEKVSPLPFKKSWWYRKEFYIEDNPGALLLYLKGVNYKADVWLNGTKIADSSVVKNAFRQFRFNITKHIVPGKNVLAIEVFPPVAGDFSIGFVDWNPSPPDRNMGLFRGVSVEADGGTGIDRPFVVSTLNEDFTIAYLTASAEVTNYTDVKKPVETVLTINGRQLKKSVLLEAGQTKKVVFSPGEFKELTVLNPKLWWPHTIGNPNLYTAQFEAQENRSVSDKKEVTFGIRKVSHYFTEEGFRGFKINGRKILIRGGGWVDRLFLDDTYESTRNQLAYVKDMNLNTIRLEGFWGKDPALYHLCDSMGILVMAGWSCQWEWEDYLGKPTDEEYGGILTDREIDMMSSAWRDQLVWLRNHPSVFAWLGGSDCKPKPELEQRYFNIFSEYDSTRVYLASAKEWTSLAGPTGVKMRGPYAYEPPVYWFSDTLYGGAFGFNTETGPGAQVPPAQSVKKMLSPEYRWPVNKMWNYHCGRHEFETLDRYYKALELRYGTPANLEDFTRKAQVMNYELMRPMFEAFSAYRYKATGVIQWMLNSAWPEMYWQLYDYYLMPNGAYYGAKKASQPLHAIYDYSSHSVYAVNDRIEDKLDLSLKIRIYNIKSEKIFDKNINLNLKANASEKVFTLPQQDKKSPVYFLDLRLYDAPGNEIDNNFYWLSSKKDILDYDAEVLDWYYYTPSKQYAGFTALNTMPEADVKTSFTQIKGKEDTRFEVTVINRSNTIAFFTGFSIRDKNSGDVILPVLWSDNYISLLPGEKRILVAKIKNSSLTGKIPELVTEGYNLKKR